MASAFFRGRGEGRRWFARFKGTGGVWRARRVRVQTRAQALAIARKLEGEAELRRHGLLAPEGANDRVGPLLQRWADGLANRSAYDDKSRVRLHLLPRWGGARLSDVTLASVMGWLDDMRAEARISTGTQRHALGLLSRFFSWGCERGLAESNPCRMIPAGKRPRGAIRREVPWIEDDAIVGRIMAALPEPFELMFYVGNRAGLRLGEIAGLRISDVADLGAGAFRVRFSYVGPLKEDKAGGKVKWCPAPSDAAAVLGPWIAKRRAATADPEAFFREALGLELTWYEATRHSFASRNLSRGAGLDEVADALGHSTPAVTRRHYAHFIRKTYSSVLTAALVPDAAAPVSRPAEPAPAGAPRNTPGMTNAIDREQGVHRAS
jgi:integrase